MSQLFESGGQSIGPSASASVFLMNIQGSFPLEWTGWISLQSKGLSRVFSNTTVQMHQFFSTQPSLWSSMYYDTNLPTGDFAVQLWKPCLTSQCPRKVSESRLCSFDAVTICLLCCSHRVCQLSAETP